MKFKKIIIGVIVLVVGIGAWYYVNSEINRKSPSMLSQDEDFETSSIKILDEYTTDQLKADKKYLGKIILLSGKLKSVETDEKGFHTIVLGDSTSMSSVRCSMDKAIDINKSSLLEGKEIVLKGECTGYNPDDMGLGADIIINRCVIINK